MNHHAIRYVVLVCSNLLRGSEEVSDVYDTSCNERKTVVCCHSCTLGIQKYFSRTDQD